jgi:hypothetical protein
MRLPGLLPGEAIVEAGANDEAIESRRAGDRIADLARADDRLVDQRAAVGKRDVRNAETARVSSPMSNIFSRRPCARAMSS